MRLAQALDGHAGALDVPAGAGVAPRGRPEDARLQLRQRGTLEEGEVAAVVFIVVIVGRRGLGPRLLQLDPGEGAVVRRAVDAEIDGAEFLVGQSLFQQAAGLFHHVGDVLAGPGVVVRAADAEGVEGLEEDPLPAGGEVLQFSARLETFLDGAVVDVAEVHGVFDLVAAAFEVASQHVGEDQAAAEAQVGRPVQARPAGINGHLARRDRIELFHAVGEGVVESQRLGDRLGNEERSGKVTLAAVGQQGHDGALAQGPRLVDGHLHGRPGAHAHEDPFLAGQAAGGLVGGIVVDRDDRRELVGLENSRRVALLHILEALDLVALEGFDADDADRRIELAQDAADAHQGPGGPHREHHDVDLAAGGLPDFPARALVVGLPVGVVVELVHQDVFAGFFAAEAIGFFDCPVGAPVAGGEEDLGPVGAEDPLAFLAGRLAHRDQELVALHCADHGQADGRVAAAGLQDDLAGGQLAAGLGLLDHSQGDAVLHRPAGVPHLQFRQEFDARGRVHAVDAHQRRAADQIENGSDFYGPHDGILGHP